MMSRAMTKVFNFDSKLTYFNIIKTSSIPQYRFMSDGSNKPKKIYKAISDTRFNDEKCNFCNGMRVLRCMTCDGFGRYYFDGEKEDLCNDCKGRGSCVCIFCNGTGADYFNIY